MCWDVYLLHDVILAIGGCKMKQSVPSHVDNVDACSATDEDVQDPTVTVHGGIVHGSEPMLVPAEINNTHSHTHTHTHTHTHSITVTVLF